MSKANEILEAFDKIDFGFEEVDNGSVCSTIKTVGYPKKQIISAIEQYFGTIVNGFEWDDDYFDRFFGSPPSRRQRFIYNTSTENGCHGYIEITGWRAFLVGIIFIDATVVFTPSFQYN